MNKIDFLSITAQFDDVKSLLASYTSIKKREAHARRKLITSQNRYKFLSEIVGIRAGAHLLVSSLVKYFKFLGYKIDNVGTKLKEEDLRLWVDNRLIIIEVTGTDRIDLSEDKAHQISKHIQLRKKEHPALDVSGVFIVNHANRLHFTKRNNPFPKPIQKIANSHHYSLVTTKQLLEYFIMIKQGVMSKEDLIKKITTFT